MGGVGENTGPLMERAVLSYQHQHTLSTTQSQTMFPPNELFNHSGGWLKAAVFTQPSGLIWSDHICITFQLIYYQYN